MSGAGACRCIEKVMVLAARFELRSIAARRADGPLQKIENAGEPLGSPRIGEADLPGPVIGMSAEHADLASAQVGKHPIEAVVSQDADNPIGNDNPGQCH